MLAQQYMKYDIAFKAYLLVAQVNLCTFFEVATKNCPSFVWSDRQRLIQSFIFGAATSDGNSINSLSLDGSRFVCRVFAEVLAQGMIIPADLCYEVWISLLPAKRSSQNQLERCFIYKYDLCHS
jgi:hypothetical protein